VSASTSQQSCTPGLQVSKPFLPVFQLACVTGFGRGKEWGGEGAFRTVQAIDRVRVEAEVSSQFRELDDEGHVSVDDRVAAEEGTCTTWSQYWLE
jgi:hypothetical protein